MAYRGGEHETATAESQAHGLSSFSFQSGVFRRVGEILPRRGA
jgi:hypothetical protein